MINDGASFLSSFFLPSFLPYYYYYYSKVLIHNIPFIFFITIFPYFLLFLNLSFLRYISFFVTFHSSLCTFYIYIMIWIHYFLYWEPAQPCCDRRVCRGKVLWRDIVNYIHYTLYTSSAVICNGIKLNNLIIIHR